MFCASLVQRNAIVQSREKFQIKQEVTFSFFFFLHGRYQKIPAETTGNDWPASFLQRPAKIKARLYEGTFEAEPSVKFIIIKSRVRDQRGTRKVKRIYTFYDYRSLGPPFNYHSFRNHVENLIVSCSRLIGEYLFKICLETYLSRVDQFDKTRIFA